MSTEKRRFYIVLDLEPMPWKRTRGAGRARYKDSDLRAYQASIADAVNGACKEEPMTGPLSVCLSFFKARPTKRPKKVGKAQWATGSAVYYPSVPDIDNLVKGVLDATNKTKLWNDDDQVVRVNATKFYAGVGEEPRIVFYVEELE